MPAPFPKDRMFGAGAILSVETSVGSDTFYRLGLLTDFQLASDTRPTVDLTGLEDQAFVGGLGIPLESNLNFTHIWDADPTAGGTPAEDDRADQLLDDYWQSGASVQWKIEETDGTATIEETIYGRVRDLVPTQITSTEGKRREVVVLRDGSQPRTRLRTPART